MDEHQLEELLNDYLDGDLSQERIVEVEKILKESETARKELESIRRLKNSLQGITTTEPSDEYFQDLSDRVMAQTINGQPSAGALSRVQNILKVMIRVAAVVTLLFVAFFITTLHHDKNQSEFVNLNQDNGFYRPDSINKAHAVEDMVSDPIYKKSETSQAKLRFYR